MFYFVIDESNQLYKITEEEYKEIKSKDDFVHSLLNHFIGKQEWINPETNEWETHDVEDLET